jgi:hypothetical protein
MDTISLRMDTIGRRGMPEQGEAAWQTTATDFGVGLSPDGMTQRAGVVAIGCTRGVATRRSRLGSLIWFCTGPPLL